MNNEELRAEIKTDCRSEDGITVGLIDSIITSCRVLSSRDLTCEAAVEALRDLRSDSDVSLIKPSHGEQVREGQEPVATVTIQHFRQDPRMENLHFQLQAELPQGTHKLYASPVAQEPDIEQIMAKAKELFGWSAGLGGFDDAVRELVAFTAGHRFAQPAPAAPAADAGLVEALEQITRMTYDEWTNGAVASRIAEEALAAYREAQEKK